MNSAEDLCNLALSHIGVEPITDLNGTDKISRTCNTHYTSALKYVLGQHFWNFAMTRAEIAKDASVPAFGWSARFSLPSDFLLLYGFSNDSAKFDYEIEDGYLLCNKTSLKIKYVKYFTSVSNMDPAFIKALAYYLAADLAWPLNQSRSLGDKMELRYEKTIRNAKATDAISAPINEIIDDTWMDARVNGAQPYGRFNA